MTRLNEAFDAVRASEALKTQTAQAVVREMRAGGARRRGRRLLPALAVAVCLLVATGLGGHALYYTPTTVLSIDINPSLEMDINRFDRVIALNGYNDDGAALAAALDVQNLRYDEAVDALLANATIADCLARGEELAIAVVQAQDDAAQSGAVLDYVSGCTDRHENAHCYALEAGDAQLAEAHDAGLSCGKYHVYQALLAYNPSLTAEEAQQMTMRELRDLLAQYQGEAATDAGANGAHQRQGAGNGQGYGAGNGSGQGRHGAGHGGHHGRGHE